MAAEPIGSEDAQRTTFVVTFWNGNRTAAVGASGSGACRQPAWRQPASSPSLPSCASHLPATMRSTDAGPDGTPVAWSAAFKQTTFDANIAMLGAVTSSDISNMLLCVKEAHLVAPVWLSVNSSTGCTAFNVNSCDTPNVKRPRLGPAHVSGAQETLPPLFPLPPLRFFLTNETEIVNIYHLPV